MSESGPILSRPAGGVALLQLNRPQSASRRRPEDMDQLLAQVGECERDAKVNALVFTGTDAHFSSGFDLGALTEGLRSSDSSTRGDLVFARLADRLEASRLVTITATIAAMPAAHLAAKKQVLNAASRGGPIAGEQHAALFAALHPLEVADRIQKLRFARRTTVRSFLMLAPNSQGPLAGVIVVGVTRALAGPYCTMVLSDLGARVIEVEMPGSGEESCSVGPFISNGDGTETSACFFSVNRNKESIALSLKDADDRVVFDRLLENADVLVENFTPATMKRFGYDWTALHQTHERLILASLSGSGQTGPCRELPAHDMVVQAPGGLLGLTGEEGGRAARVGVSIDGLAAGMFQSSDAYLVVAAGTDRMVARLCDARDLPAAKADDRVRFEPRPLDSPRGLASPPRGKAITPHRRRMAARPHGIRRSNGTDERCGPRPARPPSERARNAGPANTAERQNARDGGHPCAVRGRAARYRVPSATPRPAPGRLASGAKAMNVGPSDGPAMQRITWDRLGARLLLLWVLCLAGCAGVLPAVERMPSHALQSPADAPLVALTTAASIPQGMSGAWPLAQGIFALDARLTLISNATTSLDLQYYLVGNDSTGRLIMRALRDAARRGVRVRLLVDDLYTAEIDALLEGLAAEPNVEVRLFNPFITTRISSGRRLLAFGLDFQRLNHRMHNKLFVADNVAAIVGGRNLADEYFLRGPDGNFIDFDLLLMGNIARELGGYFDLYWNSEPVFPLADVLRASGQIADEPELLRLAFDRSTAADTGELTPPQADAFGAPPFSRQLAENRLRVVAARTTAFVDQPDKIAVGRDAATAENTLANRFLRTLEEAQEDVLLVSPYFIPGPQLFDRLRQVREAGVRVRIVTNSLAVSDEPLVSIGAERHRLPLLKAGVELYELSLTRMHRLEGRLRNLFGATAGRLHAKIGFIDRRTVVVGSLNLDPRSASINTEIGVAVHSADFARMALNDLRIEEMPGVYQVRLKPDGSGVRWTSVDPDDGEDDLDTEPDTSVWQRVRLFLISIFVPESQL